MISIRRRSASLAGLCALAALSGCAGISPSNLSSMMTWGQRGKKVYDVHQKLQSMNFTIRTEASQGDTAFVASCEVKRVPVGITFDLSNLSQPAKAVSVAGVNIALTGKGPFSIGADYRQKLLATGVAPDTLTEIEKTVNGALEAVASVSG